MLNACNFYLNWGQKLMKNMFFVVEIETTLNIYYINVFTGQYTY